MQGLEANEYEQGLGKWLQSLFDFETNVSYNIYDYGTRHCTVIIEAAHETPPSFHTSNDSLDWMRGKNSIVVAKFARENLPKGEGEYYCAMKGFMIPIEKLQVLKDKMTIKQK